MGVTANAFLAAAKRGRKPGSGKIQAFVRALKANEPTTIPDSLGTSRGAIITAAKSLGLSVKTTVIDGEAMVMVVGKPAPKRAPRKLVEA